MLIALPTPRAEREVVEQALDVLEEQVVVVPETDGTSIPVTHGVAPVSHPGVGRLGQTCWYSISGETHSRHCWWLMLAVSLAHSMSGDATAGHSAPWCRSYRWLGGARRG